jgi:hypothetical protein
VAVTEVTRLGVRSGQVLERVRPSWVAPVVLPFAVYLGVFLIMKPEATGDEPHYLLVAQSIAFDGDVDLRNDYASKERTLRVTTQFPLDRHGSVYKSSGELRPLHGVGLSILLAPAVALGGLTGARLMMILIAALLADQLYRLLRDLGFRRLPRWAAWVGTAFCLPLVVFSNQVYPELPGALLLVVAFRIAVAKSHSPGTLALGASAAASMAWLHVRFLPLSVAALIGLAVGAFTAETHSASAALGSRLARAKRSLAELGRRVARSWRTKLLPLAVPYAAILGLLALLFERWYGTPRLTGAYDQVSETRVGTGGGTFFYHYVVSDLFNPVYGWIPYVPLHWLGLAAFACLAVRFGKAGFLCAAAAVGYELLLASGGLPPGWGLPARYLLVLIPLIAVPLALTFDSIRAARVPFALLLGISLVFAAAGVRDYYGLFPIGEKPRIFGARSTAFLYPNPRPLPVATSFTVTPKEFQLQTGHREGEVVVARAGRDPAGFVTWGPYKPLREGTYLAKFRLRASGAAPDEAVAMLEAIGAPPIRIFGQRAVTTREIRDAGTDGVHLPFKTPGGYMVETRLYYTGKGTLRASGVEVVPGRVVMPPLNDVPEWVLALCWLAVTVVVGGLMAAAMLRTRRRQRSGPARATSSQ